MSSPRGWRRGGARRRRSPSTGAVGDAVAAQGGASPRLKANEQRFIFCRMRSPSRVVHSCSCLRCSMRFTRFTFTWLLWRLCLACGDSTPCELAACGKAAEVELTDHDGNPVAARGEARDVALQFVVPFDCSGMPSDVPSLSCRTNLLVLAGFGFHPESVVDVRFTLRNGSVSEWQSLSLHLSKNTEADFNGPGCPCSWYGATVDPVVVPMDARLPLPE